MPECTTSLSKTSLKRPVTKPALSCINVSCGYPSKVILKQIDFDLYPGKIVALIGSNGSGKSTLLKTISKDISSLSGKIFLDDQDITYLSNREIAKRMVYLPQSESSMFHFTALEIVLMGRTLYSNGLFETDEDLMEAKKAMIATNCEHLSGQLVHTLSGGEYQRVLVARALTQKAKILLLDEPISHLDLSHQMSFAKLIKNLAAQEYSILISVHDLNWASEVADSALLLDKHLICYHGPMQNLLASPILEKIYQVPFSFIKGPNGHLKVFPHFSISSPARTEDLKSSEIPVFTE